MTMRAVGAIGILLIVSAAGCTGSTGGAGSTDYSADDTSKFTQTWPKSYSGTSCAEWNSQMTPEQQFAASADMLAGARNKGDGGTGLPDDSLIDQFLGGVTTACVEPTATVAEIGAMLYLTERESFRP